MIPSFARIQRTQPGRKGRVSEPSAYLWRAALSCEVEIIERHFTVYLGGGKVPEQSIPKDWGPEMSAEQSAGQQQREHQRWAQAAPQQVLRATRPGPRGHPQQRPLTVLLKTPVFAAISREPLVMFCFTFNLWSLEFDPIGELPA